VFGCSWGGDVACRVDGPGDSFRNDFTLSTHQRGAWNRPLCAAVPARQPPGIRSRSGQGRSILNSFQKFKNELAHAHVLPERRDLNAPLIWAHPFAVRHRMKTSNSFRNGPGLV